jgi:hypothetical protein
MDGDCTFRYRLDGARREPIHSGRLAEMMRQQLRNILDIAQPLREECEVSLDAFRWLGPERRQYEIYQGGCREKAVSGLPAARHADVDDIPYQSLANASLYEPRIEFIARQLASLLSVVELESAGKPVEIDGFRLRDLEDWVGPHAATAADIFNHAATHCQYDCVFCYNRGLLPSLQQAHEGPEDTRKVLEKRVGLYNPRAGRGLFPTFGSPREVLAHPRILPLLRQLREVTDEPFRLCTNGGALDGEFVEALAELSPLYVDLSLNSASPERRSLLMGDRQPEKAIAVPDLLSEAGIPFAVTIVAWPLPGLMEMLEDLERTAGFADAAQARMVQVNLPGYSRFFCDSEPFDTATVWGETVRVAQRLRGAVSCPVVVSPSLCEENITRERKNQPEVIGVVKNSPAARWGLAAGDMVTAVNGIPVSGRPQARDLLSLLQKSGGRGALTVVREGKEIELCGKTADWSYPFDTATGTHLGAVFMGAGLRSGYLERLEALVRENAARETLFLTSTLVRPTLEQLLRERPLSLPQEGRLRLAVPRNRFFGGNIVLGDLLVVQDFIDFLSEYAGVEEARPDLVVIPSSPFHLSGWGRDLTGRPYQDIERETGLRVRLLECHPIWE